MPDNRASIHLVALVVPSSAVAILYDGSSGFSADYDPEGYTGLKTMVVSMGFPQFDGCRFHGVGLALVDGTSVTWAMEKVNISSSIRMASHPVRLR